mmetsp:Transcript_34495/g.39910  ORF Transcript_34495/g.39910 Transcript_34495/m.39910 type:complete len:161 (-) Transcript_34495:15-497(-)
MKQFLTKTSLSLKQKINKNLGKLEKIHSNQARLRNDLNKKLGSLASRIRKKIVTAERNRSASVFTPSLRSKEDDRRKKVLVNLEKEKHRMQLAKFEIFKKGKMDEFRAAQKKHNDQKVRKVFGDILWMQNKDKAAVSTVLKGNRVKRMRHSSLENLMQNF